MKIERERIYGILESVLASGYPMTADVEAYLHDRQGKALPQDCDRAVKLANTPIGTGHDNFLTGVVVQCDVTASNAWWLQFGRYHFAQIVSSQSKMHRLRSMLRDDRTNECFHAKTQTPEWLPTLDDESLIYSCPLGLLLTARISTNYRQLKTIYAQRRTHKLQEWRDFCKWIEELPFAEEWFCRKLREKKQ